MVCCSNIMLTMLARGVEITLAAYFSSSLLMLSGPAACPFLRDFSALVISSAVTGWLRGHGLPINGSSGSSAGSESLCANHLPMASALP